MKLGVSSCLLGSLCRYDGSHSRDQFVTGALSEYFDLIPYCPEAHIFGTPRDTLRMVEVDGSVRVLKSKDATDVTRELQEVSQLFCQEVVQEELCGFVLKSKSPTCGIERVKVYQEKNSCHEKKGEGLFAQALRAALPYLPIEEEGRLNDPWLKENFLMQVYAYADLQTFIKQATSLNALVEFHTQYKYLIYAKSQQAYKEMGNIVANHDKKPLDTILKEYQEAFLKAIAMKGSVSKTYNVLLHIMGYFKKQLSLEEKHHLLDTCDEYKEGIVPLIAVIKLLNIYVIRFEQTYLKNQKFLNPYPKELALRSDVKAFK